MGMSKDHHHLELIDCQFQRVCYGRVHLALTSYQIVTFSKTNEKINAIIVNIRLIKMKNRWKYSVKQCQFDGKIIFVLKCSQEKNMFVLNSSSNPFHVYFAHR